MKHLRTVLLILACIPLVACSTTNSARRTWWNPTTWFSGSAGREAVKADAKVEAAQDGALDAAQKTAHETQEALAVAPVSRPVEVARESNGQTVTLLDQVRGPLNAAEVALIRARNIGLLSENAEMRASAENARAKDRANIEGLSSKLDQAEKARAKATGDLQEAFARENALANKYRNLWWGAGVLAFLSVLAGAGLLYAKYMLGGFPAAAGKMLSALCEKDPKAGELVTQIFDGLLNRHEQEQVRKNAA